MNIESNILRYINGDQKSEGLKPTERYASFDYCFNYFQSFRESGTVKDISHEKNIQESCLQLGFYLASWGMFRGSSTLLQKSLKIFEPVIKTLSIKILESQGSPWKVMIIELHIYLVKEDTAFFFGSF